MRHVAATKFCRGDKILIDLPPNVEVFTPGDLSLQPIAAMSAYDLSLDCTHKANLCCSNVLQRFVASCVPTLTLLLSEMSVVEPTVFSTWRILFARTHKKVGTLPTCSRWIFSPANFNLSRCRSLVFASREQSRQVDNRLNAVSTKRKLAAS